MEDEIQEGQLGSESNPIQLGTVVKKGRPKRAPRTSGLPVIDEYHRRGLSKGLSAIGYGLSFSNPALGISLLAGDLYYDLKDVYNEPSVSNLAEVAGDLGQDFTYKYWKMPKEAVGKLKFNFAKPVLKKIFIPLGAVDAANDAKGFYDWYVNYNPEFYRKNPDYFNRDYDAVTYAE